MEPGSSSLPSTSSWSVDQSAQFSFRQRIIFVSSTELQSLLFNIGIPLLTSFRMVATHIGAIERHLPESLPIQRAHMQTTLLPTLVDSYNSLIYLYRLRPGFAGTSHACHCARLCGVPESVVERADQIQRVGLRAWHDSEAVRDEKIVRRLLQLELGNDSTGEDQERAMERRREVGDEGSKKLVNWVLQAGDEPQTASSSAGFMEQDLWSDRWIRFHA